MDKKKMDHNIIEYILALLGIPDNTHFDFNYIMDGNWKASMMSLLDMQNIQTAYKVIKFMDEMPGGFLIYHADGNEEIIYANKALLRIFKCDTMDDFRKLTGNSFRGIVHPDDLEDVEQSIREQISNSQYDLDYVEYRIISKDGRIHWIEDYGHFIHSELVGDIFYVFLGDATEKKRRYLAEHASLLEEKSKSEQKMKDLMEEYIKERKSINQEQLRRLEVIEGLSINYETILYADLDHDKILPYRLSIRTERQFDQTLQVRSFQWFVTDYAKTWVHPEDRDFVSQATSLAYIREKLAEKKTYYINYRIIIEHEVQYIQLRIVNVGNKEQLSQIVMGYRRVDEELKREMEQKQMLEEALSGAKLAINAKNTFLSNMSHDMRTPLNAIFGFTELAKKAYHDPSAIQAYLAKIETSSRQLLDLIEKALEISWMESNDIRITETECNLQKLLQDVYKTVSAHALDKNISLSLDFSDIQHWDIYCDGDKLKQLLFYLADNAVTYTQNDGEVHIIVSELEKLPNNFASYQFMVKDTGIGIHADFLEHIFEPFEREKNTTFSGIHGTGLGLTIAQNIAEMMGGQIEATSTVGEGSAFTLTLRFCIQQSPSLPSNGPIDLTALLADKKILLVEDNEINLEIETALLEGLGFTVETAEDGAIAVEKIKASRSGEYSLILMDIQMPIMDGRQATREIRSLPDKALAHIPIIALSANAFESDKRLSIECGMNAHLTKPIDIPALLETVSRIFQTLATNT